MLELFGFAALFWIVKLTFQKFKEYFFPPDSKTYRKEERQAYILKEWEKRTFPSQVMADAARETALIYANWSGAPTEAAFYDTVAEVLDRYENPTPELVKKVEWDLYLKSCTNRGDKQS